MFARPEVRRHLTVAVGLSTFIVIALLAAWFLFSPAAPPARAQENTDAAPSRADRGKYLVEIVGCSDCHTPMKMTPTGPEPDMARFLSGHPAAMAMPPAPAAQGPWLWSGAATNTAFAGPWGTSFCSNLTPDPTTGMSFWTEEMFLKAMRTGKHLASGRPIQPPMPWQSFSRMTDEDLKSVYAYLRTIPPVKNAVPDYQPPKAP